jgi:serine/threonine protein kinase
MAGHKSPISAGQLGKPDESTVPDPQPLPAEKPEPSRKKIKISCHKCGQKLDLTHLEPFAIIECPVCDQKLIVPKWFDNYLLEEPGGVGGMATVYRALDLSLDREVAIKVLNPDVAIRKDRGELFLHEARTAATINHFGVIPVFTCGEFDGQPYIIMQFMEGGSLEDKLKMTPSPLPVADVCRWIRDVAEGLDNARKHGIVHHDIKPGNIMLDDDGNAKIGDFGIAQAIHDSRTEKVFEVTRTWLSPHYVSPEKVATGKEDFLGDIYSLGATFFHLVTGRTPFEEEDVARLIRMRLDNDPPEPKSLRSDIPEKISNLVMSMLNRDIDARPNYREIIKAIDYCMKETERPGEPGKPQPQRKEKPDSAKIDAGQSKRKKLKFHVDSAFKGKVSQKRSWISYVYHLIMSCVLAGCLWYLYKTGYGEDVINRLMGRETKPADLTYPQDQVPVVTWAFQKGESSEAEKLAKEVFDDPFSSEEKRLQAGAQLAIAAYLNRAPDPEETCQKISRQLLDFGADPKDDLLAVIFFLSNRDIPPDGFRDRVSGDLHLSLIGSLAIFLREIQRGAPKNSVVEAYLKFASESKNSPKRFWGNAWQSRLPSWESWVRTGSARGLLEPIFVPQGAPPSPPPSSATRDRTPLSSVSLPQEPERLAADGTASAASSESDDAAVFDIAMPQGELPGTLGKMSEQEFAETRRSFGTRPYLGAASLDYDPQKVEAYLESLPEDLRSSETTRYDFVKNSKKYLVRFFRMSEYVGPVIARGKTIRDAKISLANEHNLLVKIRNSDKTEKITWNDLLFNQYIHFYCFIANERRKVTGPNMTPAEQKRLAAEEYLLLAVLCDWHGWYKDALKYGKKAIETDPAMHTKVDRIFLNR